MSWATTRLNGVQQGGPSYIESKLLRPYSKPHASANERIEHLKSKGLIITRPNVAAKKIEAIGYERLRIYFLSRRDAPRRTFRTGTTYKEILQIYECDSCLRNICFEAVGLFEIIFRNTLSEALSTNHGSHPYDDLTAFKNSTANNTARHQLIDLYQRSKDDRARHYKTTYDSPAMPPIWTLKEFLTFGAAARLYSTLANSNRNQIAQIFGVASLPIFDNWVTCFVDLRNICAHHDRLFNRSFQKQPQRLNRANIPTGQPHSLKAVLECLDHALLSCGEKTDLVLRTSRIINLKKHAPVDPREAGF